MNELSTWIWLGGWVQLAIVAAAVWAPVILDWRQKLSPLDAFMRRLFWVYAAFIMGVNVAFGVLSVTQAAVLAGETTLARMLCGFIGLYWLARLAVQFFVFNQRPPHLHSGWLITLGYHCLTVAFVYLAAVYLVVAVYP
jgi:hypothetical protein